MDKVLHFGKVFIFHGTWQQQRHLLSEKPFSFALTIATARRVDPFSTVRNGVGVVLWPVFLKCCGLQVKWAGFGTNWFIWLTTAFLKNRPQIWWCSSLGGEVRGKGHRTHRGILAQLTTTTSVLSSRGMRRFELTMYAMKLMNSTMNMKQVNIFVKRFMLLPQSGCKRPQGPSGNAHQRWLIHRPTGQQRR